MQLSKALLLVIAGLATVFVAGRKEIFICSSEYGEPSISEIVVNLIPDEIPGTTLLSEHSRHKIASVFESLNVGNTSIHSVLESALQLTVPVKSFVSDGLFTLTYASAQHAYTFNDVHFVYRKNFVLEYVCGYDLIGDSFTSLCNCGGGLLAIGKFDSDHYCVRNSLCSDKSVSEGVCKIVINPFEDGCLMISIRSEGSTPEEVQETEDLVRGSVVFDLVVPTLYNVWDSIANLIPTGTTSSSSFNHHSHKANKQGVASELVEKLKDYTTITLQNLPLYPVNLVVGYWLVTNARDLTDAPLVQLIMQGIYGLFLAFIILAYLLYR